MKSKKGITLILLVLLLVVGGILTVTCFKQNVSNLITTLDKVRIDYVSPGLSGDKYLDLKISNEEYEDLHRAVRKHIRRKQKLDFNYFAKHPVKKRWVNCQLRLNGIFKEAMIKFHGTHPRHYLDNKFSYTVKLNKSEEYIGGGRRFKLIKGEDADPCVVAINTFSNSEGLISAKGKMMMLRINGELEGHYCVVEDIRKEVLERDYGITNYSILTNTNDKTRKEGWSHISGLDLFFGHIKREDDLHFPKALERFRVLASNVEQRDSSKVAAFFEEDYIAKFLAVATLFNDIHFMSGDNLRMVYDFHRGKFYPIYRAESSGIPVQNGHPLKPENFNHLLFKSCGDVYNHSPTSSLYKVLLSNPSIRLKRDSILFELAKNRDSIIGEFDKVYKENQDVMERVDRPTRSFYKLHQTQQNRTILTMSKAINNYLSYAHVYGSIDSLNGKLHILFDSFVPITICDDSGQPIYPNNEGISLTSNLGLVYNHHVFELDTNYLNHKKLKFINTITKDTISKKHVHINYIKVESDDYAESLDVLKNNGINYRVENEQLTILPGNYELNEDLMIDNFHTVTLSSGVTLNLAPAVNVNLIGNLEVKGTTNSPVQIRKSDDSLPFGCFSVVGINQSSTTFINHLHVSGGGESYFDGRLSTGQFVVIGSNVELNNSTFSNSHGDDGLNLKYCKVSIKNCTFKNNKADQVDLDFCLAKVSNCTFNPSYVDSNGDGLDFSGSYGWVNRCVFESFEDKGLSLGEKSKILVSECSFNKNNSAIAVKDETSAYLFANFFTLNQIDITSYIKKKIFRAPIIYIDAEDEDFSSSVLEHQINSIESREFHTTLAQFEAEFDKYQASPSLIFKHALTRLISP